MQRLEDRGFGIELSDQAKTLLADRGFDPAYGARPLKRVIQSEVQNELAKALLGGEFSPSSTIEVTVDGESLSFSEK